MTGWYWRINTLWLVGTEGNTLWLVGTERV